MSDQNEVEPSLSSVLIDTLLTMPGLATAFLAVLCLFFLEVYLFYLAVASGLTALNMIGLIVIPVLIFILGNLAQSGTKSKSSNRW